MSELKLSESQASCCQPAPVGSCCSTQTVPSAPPGRSAVVDPAPPPASDQAGWRPYTPLLVIFASVLLSTLALQLSLPAVERSTMLGMSQFMGIFLVIFAMLKLFDLAGFVNGFSRYDLLAGPVRPYGYVYPFLELGLGLALLAQFSPFAVNAALAVLMFFGAAGVLRSLRRGESLRCACMGSSLNVPLSTVALVEDVGMGLMSLAMLVWMS